MTGFAAAARLVRGLTWLNLGVAVALFAASMALLSVDIVLRYGWDDPIDGAAEGVTIAFVWVFLLGAAALYARSEDIAVDFVYQHLPRWAQAWLLLAIQLAIALAMAVVLRQTLIIMEVSRGVLTPALRLPLGIEFAGLVAAAASIFVSSLVEAWACALWLATGEKPVVFVKTVEEGGIL